MEIGEVRGSRKDVNVRTAQLVQLLSQIGPDIPEIARRLGQFKESVRYRYKTKILDKGFAVQAVVDNEKLGLRHLEMVVDFADDIREYVQPILIAMSELCYISGFEKIFPTSRYVARADVPAEHVPGYIGLIEALQQKGLFSSVDIHVFDWFRRIPMRAQFYDFNAGRWDYDWSAKAMGEYDTGAYTPSEKGSFDYLDLLILKELHLDASRSLVEISTKLKENYKKLAWHYGTHILGSKLVKGYTLRWPGTKYDYKVDRVLHRQHRYFWTDVIVSDPSKVERMGLMSEVNKLPFLWAEAGGKDYFAQLAFPVDFFTEAMQRLERVLGPVRDRAKVYLPDQTDALAFSLSYKLYDRESKRWTFDASTLQSKFDELVLKIRERGG